MSGPYRGSSAPPVDCPRCHDLMPAGWVAACPRDCGVWIDATVASDAFAGGETAPSRQTSWFRERAPCPLCHVQMTLRGHDMTLFLGCDEHGFWVDESTVTQTGLARPAFAARLAEARGAAAALAAARQQELERARESAQAAELAIAHAQQAEREAADRAAFEARVDAENARKAREAELASYVARVRAAIVSFDPMPLAEELWRLDRAVQQLTERLDALDPIR